MGWNDLWRNEINHALATGDELTRSVQICFAILIVVQVFALCVLGLVLLALGAVIVAVNPDLEAERRKYVTPLARWAVVGVAERRWVPDGRSWGERLWEWAWFKFGGPGMGMGKGGKEQAKGDRKGK